MYVIERGEPTTTLNGLISVGGIWCGPH
jgi:hypothetical protein